MKNARRNILSLLLTGILALFQLISFAQQNVGIGTSVPDGSAILDLTAGDKGILIPRMTTAQRVAIVSPATGLLVYDTDFDQFWYFNGIVWVVAIGPQGPTGPQGAQGVTGPSGNAGIQGPTGPSGTNGAIGATGPTGAQGVTGPSGIDGANGTNGVTGPTGAQGVTGPSGIDGANGTNGVTGPTGAQGVTGPSGNVGAQGPTGPSGSDGTNGAPGVTGPTGIQGVTGPSGMANAWLLNGNAGTTPGTNFLGTTDTKDMYITAAGTLGPPAFYIQGNTWPKNFGFNTTTQWSAAGGASTLINIEARGNPGIAAISLVGQNNHLDQTYNTSIDFMEAANGSLGANNPIAQISNLLEGSNASNVGGNLVFLTRPDAGTLTERMRITGTGKVGINTPTITNTDVQLNGTSTNSVDYSAMTVNKTGVGVTYDRGVSVLITPAASYPRTKALYVDLGTPTSDGDQYSFYATQGKNASQVFSLITGLTRQDSYTTYACGVAVQGSVIGTAWGFVGSNDNFMLGGDFAASFTGTPGTNVTYDVIMAGTRTSLSGTIGIPANPTKFVASALYAADNAAGTAAHYAGYFKGKVLATGQVISTLATGTSPFSVASTTLNTNLNADMLDGIHASHRDICTGNIYTATTLHTFSSGVLETVVSGGFSVNGQVQLRCTNGNGITYIAYADGVRTSGTLTTGGTVSWTYTTNGHDLRLYVAQSVNAPQSLGQVYIIWNNCQAAVSYMNCNIIDSYGN
jgi:hypothetical protein